MSQKSIAYDGSKPSRPAAPGSNSHWHSIAVRSAASGLEPVGHHVVGEQADEQVGEQAEVVDAAPGEVVEAAERHPAAGAA